MSKRLSRPGIGRKDSLRALRSTKPNGPSNQGLVCAATQSTISAIPMMPPRASARVRARGRDQHWPNRGGSKAISHGSYARERRMQCLPARVGQLTPSKSRPAGKPDCVSPFEDAELGRRPHLGTVSDMVGAGIHGLPRERVWDCKQSSPFVESVLRGRVTRSAPIMQCCQHESGN
jgi:hypothetical protein